MINNSSTFCMFPFTGLATREDGQMKLCCKSHPIGDITKEILEEVKNIFKKKETELTPDQKRIADLEAKIEALTKKEKPEGINLLEELRAEYEKLSGTKADSRWKENKLSEFIEELKNNLK